MTVPLVAQGLPPDLAASVAEAESALRFGETQLAESRYREALRDAWMLVGAAHAADSEWSSARDAFERATRQTLEMRRAVLALASAELKMGAVDEALARLRQLQGRRPGDTQVQRMTARVLSAAGKDQEAVQELEEAHAAAPDDAELTFYLATGYLELEDFDAAERLFAEVAELRPIAETQILVGRTWRDVQEYDRARQSLNRALEMDPRVRKARFYLGTVELLDEGRGGLDLAVHHFRDELVIAPEDPVNRHFLGLSLVELRRFEEALPHLDVAVANEGTNIDGLHFRGRALLSLGRAEEAVESLERALELAEADPSAAGNQMGSIHYQLALALRRSGRNDEARPHFDAAESALEGFTDESRERLKRYLNDAPREASPAISSVAVPTLGLEALSPGERQTALRSLGDVIARANLNLGVLQSRAGRTDRAAGHFRVARETASDEGLAAQATYSQGVAWFQAGRHGEALEALESAWAQSAGGDAGRVGGTGGDPTLRRMLALTRLEIADWQGAVELLADDPQRASDPSLQYAYGTALVRSGRSDEALAVFDSLAEAGADRADLAVLFGEAYAQEGDWPAAEESLRRALQLDPQVAGAHSTLGEIFMRQGEMEKSEAELRAELAIRPGDRRSHFLLATVLDLADRHGEAEEHVRAVLEQTPNDADARYLLGKILFGRGEYEASAAQLEAAAGLAPGDPNIHYQLAQAYQRAGRRELAKATFEVYRKLQAERRAQVGSQGVQSEGEGDG